MRARLLCSMMVAAGLLAGASAQDRAPAPGAPDSPNRRWLDTTVTGAERERASTVVGLAAPEFPASVIFPGDATALESLRGKVVIVQFWSRADRRSTLRIEQLAALEKDMKGEVVVVGVHHAGGAAGVKAYLERRPAGVAVAVDEAGDYARALGAGSNLANYVIDRSGTVRYALLNPTGLEAAARQLAQELPPVLLPVSPPPEAKPSKPAASPGEKRGNKPSGEKGFWKQRIADNRFPEPTGEVGQAIDLRGRKGPAVEVEEWLTAAPDAQDKVIILDFWATWCGPCIRGIPHMNQLQSAYPDEVVVIGLSNEDAATVRAFLPNSGMRYAVGVDPQRRMWKAVQNQTIPHAIVYSPDGVVRWQGHPARLTPEILGAIVEGSRQ